VVERVHLVLLVQADRVAAVRGKMELLL